jgi:hypothetical protein
MFTIERNAYDRFLAKLYLGVYPKQRVGQAFYNEFNLHRMRDQEMLGNLYEKDGDEALNQIKNLVVFS